MMQYCAEHKDQRKDAFLAASVTGCPYCRIAELEQQLAKYKGGVEVECWGTVYGSGRIIELEEAFMRLLNKRVRALVMKEVE